MELADNDANDNNDWLEIWKGGDIFDGVAYEVDNIGEVEDSGNLKYKEFTESPCISSAVSYHCCKAVETDDTDYLM